VLFVNGLEDLPLRAQGLLVAALETRTITRVGGATPVRLNVRIIGSALPRLVASEATSGVRQELLSRLNVITLNVPPLRDYAQDVPELLRHYVDRLVDEERLPFRRFGVAAQNRLRNYPWPGNVRELKNLVQRLLILGGEEEIRLEEIERELSSQAPTNEPLVKQDLLALPLREAREHFERAYLQQQLILCNGKVGQLASAWAWSVRTSIASCARSGSTSGNWQRIESWQLLPVRPEIPWLGARDHRASLGQI
jgi:two-component system, NtrC family, nitrogen regulation response regulator NtrX